MNQFTHTGIRRRKGETGLILLINVQNKRRGIIKVGKLSKSLIYERLQRARGLIHTPVPTLILRSQRNTIFSENVTFLILDVPVFTSEIVCMKLKSLFINT